MLFPSLLRAYNSTACYVWSPKLRAKHLAAFISLWIEFLDVTVRMSTLSSLRPAFDLTPTLECSSFHSLLAELMDDLLFRKQY